MVRHGTIRLVVDLACNGGWPLFHLGIISYFLNYPLEEEVILTLTFGFAVKGKEDRVYKLLQKESWGRPMAHYNMTSCFH